MYDRYYTKKALDICAQMLPWGSMACYQGIPRKRKYPVAMGKKSAAYFVLALLCVGLFAIHSSLNAQKNDNINSDPKPGTNKSEKTVLTCAEKQKNQVRIGLQAGHWKTDAVPDELSNLQWNFGTSSNNVDEVDINLEVVQLVAENLEKRGMVVDILPTTIPESYCANAFVAVHVDGNEETSVRGYKVTHSQWDENGASHNLSEALDAAYQESTGLIQNTMITEDMSEYYAFNFEKYLHAVDKETPAAIIELGFVTNISDRYTLTRRSKEMAEGIANGIETFFEKNRSSSDL